MRGLLRIALDTNIISELMKSIPNEKVTDWIEQQQTVNLFIATPSIAEISYGLAALPKGKRRDYLNEAFHFVLLNGFKHRILVFDEAAAYAYGQLMAYRKSLGKPLSVVDGQIAAIAKVNHMSVATRNTQDFYACDVQLINPFQA